MTGFKCKQRTALACVVLVLGTLALYWPVYHYDFVQYDDPEYVFENSTVQGGISWQGIVWSVVDAHAANWHPLTWLAHMLDCQLFGLHPGAHHLVNAALHSLNAALLFLLLRAMTGAFWRCAFVAAWFAWHPLRVESVAWIAERKDVLSGFFFLLTLWTYALYAKGQVARPAPGKGISAAVFYKLSLCFFALGLLSKPMLVTVPALLLLIDMWPLRRLPLLRSLGLSAGQEAVAPTWFIWRRLLREKLPFILLSGASAVLTVWAQRAGGAVVPLRSEGVLPRMANVLLGYPAYLEKLFWPVKLSCLYLRPQEFSTWSLVLGALALLAISVAVGLCWRQRPYLVIGWLWFLGMLLPVSGLVQVGLQSVADRYTYLPAIGIGLSLAWGTGELVSAWKSPRIGTLGLAAGGCFLLVVCGALTRQQLAYWRNTETLMSHALAIDPGNYVAHQNLAVYYSRIGREDAARQHRQAVRKLDPALAQKPASLETSDLRSKIHTLSSSDSGKAIEK